MSTSIRTAGVVARLSCIAVTLASIAGIASAQSPTLLPYVAKLVAGGGTAVIASGAKCPVSGFTSTDAYGDGCLATEIEIGNVASGAATPGSRDAVADTMGNVFFTDYQNGLVRRVDAVTGIVTAVAGGAATSPAANATCGAYTSTDARGDGCLGTAVHLAHPSTVIFSPAGDLYFTDSGSGGYGNVRKIAATNGFVPASGGIISLVMGNAATTYGYAASNPTTSPATVITPATSYLRYPYGLAFDNLGDLFVADEYYYAVLVLNTSSNTNTVNGVTVAPGTIYKVAGTVKTGGPYCLNGTTSSSGCSNSTYTSGTAANSNYLYNPFGIALDPTGNLYIANEFYDSIPVVSTAGILTTYAGIESTVAKPAATTRGAAGSFAIGSSFGVAADTASDVYITDASSGLIWRVDGGSKAMYTVAGGAKTTTVAGSPCATGSNYIATDTVGDGCPASLATLGSSGTTFATTTLPGPGVYGVHTDPYYNVYFGDTETNLVREIASQSQFGVVGANQPIQTVIVHFAVGDGPAASNPYVISMGTNNFAVATLPANNCTTNSDNTMDCQVPIQATPSTLGAFSGTLTVKSTLGATANFTLGGVYAQSPKTRLALTYADTTTICAGTTTHATTDSILLTATLVANGPNPPSGTITFSANGTPVGSPQMVVNIGTVANPVYGATLSNVFSTPNTYTFSAVYSGDTAAPIYFTGSSGTAAATLTTATPTFSLAPTTNGTTTTINGCLAGEIGQCTVTAGQTALYSVTLTETVYAGTITFSCSGAPANSTCVVAPTSLTATGCSTTGTLAVSVLTSGGVPAQTAIGLSGSGPWQLLSMAFGIGLALMIGLRRRKLPLRGLWMVLALLLAGSGLVGCTSGTVNNLPVTPKGTYTITVTATGSTGTTSSVALPLTIQ